MDLDMARKLERKQINQTIEVTDIINGGRFGELINITVEGLMAMTETEIPTQSIYQFSIKLPVDLHGSNTVELGADCLWCRKDENFHRFWGGFQIIDAADTAVKQIEDLIEAYSK
jgi:hypothetical protein